MSKLYDVISRLEEVTSQGESGEEIPQPKEAELRPKKRPAWIRVVILGILFIVLGIAVIAATAWLQKWFTDKQLATPSQTTNVISQPPETLPVEPLLPEPQLPQKIANNPGISQEKPSNPVGLQQPDNNSTQEVKPITEQFQGTMSVDIAADDITVESVEQFLAAGLFDFQELLEEATSTRTRIFIHDLDIAEIIPELNPTIQKSQYTVSQPHSPSDQKAKTSRWLHQAELYRHQGEWEGAIVLYQRVWNVSQDPAVANNLAAALIEVKRPEEAHALLKESIISAPNDPDIKQNLRIVEQVLAQ